MISSVLYSCCQDSDKNSDAVLEYTYGENGEISQIKESDTLKNEITIKEFYASGEIEKKFSYKRIDGEIIFIDSSMLFYREGNLAELMIHDNSNKDLRVGVIYSKDNKIINIDTIRGNYTSSFFYNENGGLIKELIKKNDTLLYSSTLMKDSLKGKYYDIGIYPDIEINADTFFVNETVEVYAKHPKPLDNSYYRIWFRIEGVNDASKNGFYLGDTIRLKNSGILRKYELAEPPGDYMLSSVIEILALADSINSYSSYIIEKKVVVIPREI